MRAFKVSKRASAAVATPARSIGQHDLDDIGDQDRRVRPLFPSTGSTAHRPEPSERLYSFPVRLVEHDRAPLLTWAVGDIVDASAVQEIAEEVSRSIREVLERVD